MAPAETHSAPSRRLRKFRRMFNEYTLKEVKKVQGSGRRANSNEPSAAPRRSAQRAAKTKQADSTASASTSDYGPAKEEEKKEDKKDEDKKKEDDDGKQIVEAKELAKADDEEFENDVAGEVAKCTIKTKELQWKNKEPKRTPTKQSEEVPVASAYTVIRKVEAAVKEDQVDQGLRKRKTRASKTRRGSPRRKSTTASKGTTMTPSTEALAEDLNSPLATPTALTPNTPGKDVKRQSSRPRARKSDKEKKSSDQKKEEEKEEKDMQEIDQNSREFKLAIKLMEILKRNNLLENALFPAQNETLRAFFEGGMRNPDTKILVLITKAMDFVLDAVFFKGEDLDCFIDGDLKNFIVDRVRSKPMILDVIITRPEFLPQSWGGRTVVLRAKEGEVEKKDK